MSIMEFASAYLPADRRHALANGWVLPEQANGAVLFADISGFTPLTEALARAFGPQRGAELLTRQLNAVYTALISQVDRYGGSVIGFSGDAVMCSFEGRGAEENSQQSTVNSQLSMKRGGRGARGGRKIVN